MHAQPYTVRAAAPIRGKSPGFATPLFSTDEGAPELRQELDEHEMIREFRPLRLETNLPVEWNVAARTRAPGEAALFAFCTLERGALVGSRSELQQPLRREFGALDEYPFVRLQVAKFLQDPQLIARSSQQVQQIMDLRGPSPYERLLKAARIEFHSIPRRFVETDAFRVTAALGPPITLFDAASAEDAALLLVLERLTNAPSSTSGTAAISLPNAVLAAFTHPAPFGTPFREGGVPAFICAFALEDALREVAAAHLRFFAAENMTPTTRRFLITRVRVSGELFDASAERYPSFASRESLERTQAIGRMMREHGGAGVIYREAATGASSLCLFTPNAIKHAEVHGMGALEFDDTTAKWYLDGE